MNEGLIPRRYAKALLKVAIERGDAQRMYELMNNLAQAFDVNAKLHTVVANPFVSADDKDALLTTAAGAKPDGGDATFADFLHLLRDNRRTDLVNAIAHAFVDLYREHFNIRRVSVVSATKLDPEVEKRLKAVIESHLNGASMEYSTAVDPDLVGGFVVNIDNERLDASLRNSLEQLRHNLLK